MPISAHDKRDIVAPTRIGEAAAAQPVSGVNHMDTKAVHGTGRGGFERTVDKRASNAN